MAEPYLLRLWNTYASLVIRSSVSGVLLLRSSQNGHFSPESTSTSYYFPSNKKILQGVTTRVDSKQIGPIENLGKYNWHYVKGKTAHLFVELPVSLKLFMISWYILNTIHPGFPSLKRNMLK